jgi:lysozyme
MKSSTALTIAIALVITSMSVILVANNYTSDGNEMPPLEKDEQVYGIDVSHHQGEINWDKVTLWNGKRISFAYVKATEGATFTDVNYARNIRGALDNNIPVGSYHYFRTTSPVEEQFAHFIKTVDKEEQQLIPLVDVEEKKHWDNDTFHKNFQRFLDLVENHFGKKPIIYTVNSFYNLHLSGKYRPYHFLIGRYGDTAPNMKDNSNWTIWQFSETGKIEGIPKKVDINVINSKYDLQDLLLTQ